MLFVKHFHHLNLQKFQIVNPLKFQICKNFKLETTYEGTKLVKFDKLQMLISKFKVIKMLEEETFGEFYSKMSDLRKFMVSLGKPVSDVKLI
jgi:actin-related protein